MWGVVYGAFPGLEIVHRAGVVHSNVDPLSRLKQILPHQSPVKDTTLSLPEQTPDQPLLSWEAQIDRLPTAKAAFLLTRAQSKLTTPGVQPEPLQTIVEPKLMMVLAGQSCTVYKP